MKRAALLLTFLLCLLLPASLGSCSAQYTVTESELTTLETNLTQLAKDNAQLKTLYERSQADLQTAQTRCKDLQKQAATLKRQLEGSQTQVQTLQHLTLLFRA